MSASLSQWLPWFALHACVPVPLHFRGLRQCDSSHLFPSLAHTSRSQLRASLPVVPSGCNPSLQPPWPGDGELSLQCSLCCSACGSILKSINFTFIFEDCFHGCRHLGFQALSFQHLNNFSHCLFVSVSIEIVYFPSAFSSVSQGSDCGVP